jgi:cellulose synthase/poly-beta-1,6-N-acetylglucosamine synthase-like glycosyltransferase
MLITVFGVVVTLVALAPALAAAYLLFLTVAACVGQARRRRSAGQAQARHRFAVLIPAHNEQALIGRLLDSLSLLEYPASHVDVWVVADNCDDATAAIARARGAHVLERFHATERAKGFALKWLLERLAEQQQHYDAYVVLDADSVVAPNFLQSMDAHLSGGSQVVQAYYSVLNAQASPLAALRYVALAAIHFLRPLGRSTLGLSVGLKGNGMCFAAPVLQRFGWSWFTLAEDVEFHLALVRAGLKVDFAADTWVLADMPVTLDQAASQNARWERGRIELARSFVAGLLLTAVKQRSLIALDAAIEQLIPPLSVPLALGAVCLTIGVFLNLPVPAVLGGLSLIGQAMYLLVGALLVRAPLSAYKALAYAPVYMAWKLGLYACALVMPRSQAWVRTARTPGPR